MPDVNETLKEAVAESLLTNLYQAVSGGGEEGRIVVGERPSVKYVSGFIEAIEVARRFGNGVDEAANPIHIITMGMDFLTTKGDKAAIRISPKFSLYVRMLPTTQQLKDHRTQLNLNQNAKTILREAISERSEKYKKDNVKLKKENKSEFYAQLRELRKRVMNEVVKKELGIKVDSEDKSIAEPAEEEEIAARLLREGETILEVDESEKHSKSEDLESGELVFHVFPGMEEKIPSSFFKNIRPVQRWLRIDFHDFSEITVQLNDPEDKIEEQLFDASMQVNNKIRERLYEWIRSDDPETGGKSWAYPKSYDFTADMIQKWDETLVDLRKRLHSREDPSLFALPDIDLRIVMELVDDYDNPNIKTVRVGLENLTSTQDWNSVELEESVFQSALQVKIEQNHHKPIMLDRIKPSYQYLQYLNQPALGFNNGVNAFKDDGQLLLETTWMPVYRQPRIRPLVYSDIDVRFQVLKTVEGIRALKTLPNQFILWIKKTQVEIDPGKDTTSSEQAAHEDMRFQDDLRRWSLEADKIQKGIDLLVRSSHAFDKNPDDPLAIPFRAWSYMNETMEQAAKGYDSWRLFQVAFVLAHITGIVSRMTEFEGQYDPDWDENVALLYFATGGGKTESFFGLLLFNLFFDRLRGKAHGVTAMLRYPLRLLTIQQAQRLAKILANAERIRWKQDIDGNPFAIGFWVGGTNTPNHRRNVTDDQVPKFKSADLLDEDKLLEANSSYRIAMESWNKIPECPFCKSKTALRKFPKLNDMVGHFCTGYEEDCDWNRTHDSSQPLPFYIVDQDIYEKAPSVLLGTIDKLALIGYAPSTIRRFMGMMGLAPMRNEQNHHLITYNAPSALETMSGEKLYPLYQGGVQHFHDPFPSLIIQDEAHLLEESLGTFSGIFETTFEHMLSCVGSQTHMRDIVAKVPGSKLPRMPKLVAASATVSEPQRQMENLYQRDVTQFPHPGPQLYYSFYAAPLISDNDERNILEDIEVKAHTARFYSSIMTNGRPHTSVSVEILAHFHLLITQLFMSLNSDDDSEVKKARERLQQGIEQSRLSSLYGQEIQKATNEALVTLVDLHRISLTYVTNKKGGDQIMSAEGDTTGKIHEEAGIEFEGLHSELISGAVSAGEIEEVIRMAENRPEPGEPFQDILCDDLLRSVVATSAISHGVDVDEFNSMFFAGMPSNPSEYIQSSSRVGRTHVGMSILIPTPQRRRDRYVLETHDQYHRFLERMIRPAAVNRWAENAMIRTLSSLLQVYLVAVREMSDLLNTDDEHKHMVKNYALLNEIMRVRNQQGSVNFMDHITDFIYRAIGLEHPRFTPSATDQFKLILREELRDVVAIIERDHTELITLERLFKEIDQYHVRFKKYPMNSLRDVDPAGNIQYVRPTKFSPKPEKIRELMNIIRKGRKA